MTTSRVVLITGGSSGIGAATAELLLSRGDSVVVTGRSRDRLEAFASRIGRPPGLVTLTGDAADIEDVDRWISTTLEQFGRLDVAIANAGSTVTGDLGTGDPSGWSSMVLTNVLGPALLIRATAAPLRETGGTIVLIGSVAGLSAVSGNLYSVTKHAVAAMAEGARRMLTEDGVNVVLVSPGRVETEFWDVLGGMPNMPNLTAGAVAEAIEHILAQPAGVQLNTVTIRPPRSAI